MLRYTSWLFELLNGGRGCLVTLHHYCSTFTLLLTNTLSQCSSLASPASSLSTLTQHFALARRTFVTHTEDIGCLLLTTRGDFLFKPLCWKLETTLVACSGVVKSSFLYSPFTRLWMLLFWRSLHHRLVSSHHHLGPDSSMCGIPTVPLSFYWRTVWHICPL